MMEGDQDKDKSGTEEGTMGTEEEQKKKEEKDPKGKSG